MTHGAAGPITLVLAGDVMLGRGIDQILPYPSEPRLHERYIKDARGYVRLAERRNGSIPRQVDFSYVWGDALTELERGSPDVRIVNLETSVTTADMPEWKSINYRMHPRNVGCLAAARVDCAVLANNHVLDWGEPGLRETLSTLRGAGIRAAGAGLDRPNAEAPAVLELGEQRRVLVCAFALASSGVPPTWQADLGAPGIAYLPDLSRHSLGRVMSSLERVRRPGDISVVSLHWGPNWGYTISEPERRFAKQLIDEAGADVVFGHSSHHAKAIEVYREKLILYGCGDFINDYEGIEGHEDFRGDLALLYLVTVEPGTGRLTGLVLTPFHIRRMRLERASPSDVAWMASMLEREGAAFGTRICARDDGRLELVGSLAR